MSNFNEIESVVQSYFEVASIDWLLLEQLIDKKDLKSHRAIGNDQRISIKQESVLYCYMKNLYELALLNVAFEPDFRFVEDSNRGYCGFKVVAKSILDANKLIKGLSGVVSSCPENIDDFPELNFSVFLRSGSAFSLQGPLSFVNHSCLPNCKYESPRNKKGVCFLRTLKPIAVGDELTVFYGSKYFGENNENCLCPNKKSHGSKIVGSVISVPEKSTRSGRTFSTVFNDVTPTSNFDAGIEHSDINENNVTTGTRNLENTSQTVNSSSFNSADDLIDKQDGNTGINHEGINEANGVSNSNFTVLSKETVDAENFDSPDHVVERPCSQIIHSRPSEFGAEIDLTRGSTQPCRSFNLRQAQAVEAFSDENFVPLYNTICEFCRAQTYLTNENFRPHMQKHHRFEAEFTCFICKRCFSGFKSFIKHVTQHEEQLATDSVREVNEIILKSKKPKLSEPSPVFHEVTNVIESTETVLPTQSIPFISSALGECKPKTALLENKKFFFPLDPSVTYCCKFKNCTNMLSLANYKSHLSDYHGSAFSFECFFCSQEFTSIRYLSRHVRSHHLFLKKNASFDRDSDESKLLKSTEESIINENSEVVMEERPNFEMRFKRFMDGCAGRDLLFGLLDSPNTTYTQALSFINSTANVADDFLRTVSLALSEIEHEIPSVSGSHTFNNLLSASKNFKLTKIEK